MDDLISRRAAIDALRDAENHAFNGFYKGLAKAHKIIADLPPAQPEIIRCKDCKHYYYADNRIPQEQKYVCDLDSDRWNPDDYCSYAERKTNG